MQGQSDRTRDIDQIPSRKRRTLVKLAPLPMCGFVAQLIAAPIEMIKFFYNCVNYSLPARMIA